MMTRRYRLKLATWTVVREPGAPSPRTLSSPTAVAELARDLLRDHDDDKEHVWSAPDPQACCRAMRTQFCTHVSGLWVELFGLRAMMRIRAGPSFITSPVSCCGRLFVQVSGPPVDCVAIIASRIADGGGRSIAGRYAEAPGGAGNAVR